MKVMGLIFVVVEFVFEKKAEIMDELGFNQEEVTEMVVVAEEEKEINGSKMVKWEKFIPKKVLTVLLVEVDDSTRQIIAAHLHRCNYKVVAASDGLNAWEILKQRHNNIDLILTELDLPSISGFALLTLIMDHAGCKKIPVIIMSSKDSISLVLKCMLKGATDFLIKPVRRNEVKNLWRHVWRRLAMNVLRQNLTAEQCKVEATLENQPTTNRSSDNVSSSQKNSERSEKTTEVQSSYTTPIKGHHKKAKLEKDRHLYTSDLEKKAIGLTSEEEHNEENISAALRAVGHESFTAVATEDGYAGPNNCMQKSTCNIDVNECREFSGDGENLIGNINGEKPTIDQSGVNGELISTRSTQELGLSLKGFHERENKEVDEKCKLNHSRASAFSWYNSNKKPRITSSGGDLGESNAPCSKICNHDQEIRHNVLVPPGHPTGHASQQPGNDMMFGCRVWLGYGPMLQSVCTPPTFSSVRSPTSAFQREESPFLTSPSLHSDLGSSQMCGTFGDTANRSSCQTENGNGLKSMESVGKQGFIDSSSIDLTCIPSNNVDTQQKRSAHGSLSDLTMEETLRNGGGKSFDLDKYRAIVGNRSAEREAALAKFRLKRQGRCYEKKVRYRSRKKLAEQRARVKGQFVRHALNNQDLADV